MPRSSMHAYCLSLMVERGHRVASDHASDAAQLRSHVCM